MRRSAIQALQSGLLNVRGNPKLVLLQIAQNLVVAIIGVAGMAPVVLALGPGAFRAIWKSGRQGWNPGNTAELESMLEGALGQWQLLLAALAAGGAVWTVGFLVYCWMQAGVMGRLAAGERRAAASAQPTAADFKVYTWPDFTRDAAARVWKFFWLINLLIVVGMVFLCLAIVVAGVLMALSGNPPSFAAALALGCSLVVVTFVAFFFLFAWTGVAKAEMVVADRGVLDAFGRSFSLLWRRLGGVLVLMVLFIGASVAVGIVFLPLSLGLDLVIGDSLGRQIAADVVLALIQTPINATLALALAAGLVALVQGER